MLTDALRDFNWGVYIQFHRNTLNSSTYDDSQPRGKWWRPFYFEFHFGDNCALAAHSHEDIQCIMDHFSTACRGSPSSATKTPWKRTWGAVALTPLSGRRLQKTKAYWNRCIPMDWKPLMQRGQPQSWTKREQEARISLADDCALAAHSLQCVQAIMCL